MPLNGGYDFIQKLRKALIGVVIIVGTIGVIGAGAIWFAPETNKDFFMYIAQIVSVLVAILMVGVIGLQAEIMRRQTKILEIDKLPMLMFQKVDSIQDGETQDKNQENNLNSIENQENDIQVWKRNLAFEIINISKYPVRIEYVCFKPTQKGYDEKTISEQIVVFRHIFRADTCQGVIISSGDSLIIPSKEVKPIKVQGVLRIKASNVYFPDPVLEYEYDLGSGRINKIEGLP